MKIFTTLLAILVGSAAFAQQAAFEKDPALTENLTASFTRDTFNLQFQFPTAAFVGEYGIESDGQYIYVTQWLGDSIAKYDLNGNVVDVFTIPGVSQVRDLAWDGSYFYGSPNDFKVYVLDFTNKVLVNTLYTDMNVRGIAYDADDDALWISEYWSPNFYQLDKNTGATQDSLMPTGITLTAISGLAYDNQSPGGPFLWGFSQDSTGAIIIKYDIPNQAQTGNMIDVSGLAVGTPFAGGLFIEPLNGFAGVSLGGMIQNNQIFGLELGYANALVGIIENETSGVSLYPNPVTDKLFLNFKTSGKYSVKIYNQLGQHVLSTEIQVNSAAPVSISTSSLQTGIYFIQLTNDSGSKVQKSFIK